MILDIGTHVLAMLRETVRYLGGSDDMTLQVVTAKDRLGREIATGDLTRGLRAGKRDYASICATGASSATTDAAQKMCWS